MVQRKSKKIRRRASEELNDDDRISRLPDGVIQHIFSFIDTRSAVQSSALSRNWRDIWKSHPQLNTEIIRSPNRASSSKFPDFVHKFLSRRDTVATLSTIEFRSNFIGLPLLREIITYAMSHKTRKLKIEFSGYMQIRGKLDSSLFRSRHLEQLILSIGFGLKVSPPMIWDFPALTTLSVNRAKFKLDDASKSIDLFSQFPNLKNLTLDACSFFHIDTFIINSSELETLSLTNPSSPSPKFVVSAPKLSSFTYNGMPDFSLSAKNLVSLKTVKFQTIYYRLIQKKNIHFIFNTFNQLRNVESLTINLDTLKVLSVLLRSSELQDGPFTSLKSLTLLSPQLPIPSTVTALAIYYFTCHFRNLTIRKEPDPPPPRI